MQLERLQVRQSAATGLEQSSSIPSYTGPPCCGTGCAVCVLDYWEPDEFEIPALKPGDALADHDQENHPCNITNGPAQPNLTGSTGPSEVGPTELPVCCGTGCAVCVLDYPELFSGRNAESDTLAMLEAIEQAQWQAKQIIADQNEELQ